METRRNILNILGLAAAGSATMNIEELDTLDKETPRAVPGLWQGGYWPVKRAQERLARALENMAAAIRSGEMTGHKIEVISTATADEFIHHEVRVHCEVALPETS